MRKLPRSRLVLALCLGWLCVGWASAADARTITVSPGDDHSKVESARSGDIVVIAPGTYRFGAYITASNVTIRAQDPNNRPVFDYTGRNIRNISGSYTGADRDRAAWRIEGKNVVVDGLVFQGARGPNIAPLWLAWVDSSRPSLTLRNCLFKDNTNGLMGMGDFTIEGCEFFDNGRKPGDGGAPAHNMYLFGGTLVMRFSYLHDPVEGQNFHLRGTSSRLEYNLITDSASYPGDLMTCEYYCGGSSGSRITQKLVLLGNVITQGNTQNKYQVVVVFNESGPEDGTGRADRFEVDFIHNTIIGTPGSGSRNLINIENSDTHQTHVRMYNNIIVDLTDLATIDTPSQSNWSLKGAGNCVTSGTNVLSVGAHKLSGKGAAAAGLTNFRLGKTGGCVGKAQPLPSGVPKPTQHYNKLGSGQARASNADPGAYESTNPPPPPPDSGGGGQQDSGGGGGQQDSGGGGGQPDAGGGGTFDSGGGGGPGLGGKAEGGCSVGPSTPGGSTLALLLLLCAAGALLLRRRR